MRPFFKISDELIINISQISTVRFFNMKRVAVRINNDLFEITDEDTVTKFMKIIKKNQN